MSGDALLSAIGLCRRAGMLALGFDASCVAVRKGAPLVIVASDAAQRTVRNIRLQCGPGTRILETNRTREQLGSVVGKEMAVAAITDKNFARLIQEAVGK